MAMQSPSTVKIFVQRHSGRERGGRRVVRAECRDMGTSKKGQPT